MLDRKFIRQEPDRVRKAIADKRDSGDLDGWLKLDAEHLELLQTVEELKALLMNTAVAGAKHPVEMARAMRLAAEAGRLAYQAGRIPKKLYATASSPLDGMVGSDPNG